VGRLNQDLFIGILTRKGGGSLHPPLFLHHQPGQGLNVRFGLEAQKFKGLDNARGLCMEETALDTCPAPTPKGPFGGNGPAWGLIEQSTTLHSLDRSSVAAVKLAADSTAHTSKL
jgi:hypothetical protein